MLVVSAIVSNVTRADKSCSGEEWRSPSSARAGSRRTAHLTLIHIKYKTSTVSAPIISFKVFQFFILNKTSLILYTHVKKRKYTST